MQVISSETAWAFPMKPIRVTDSVFSTAVTPERYVLEPKFDGWRAIVSVGDRVTLWTREKRQIEMPNNLKDQLASMGLPRGTVLDGEIWNPLKRGSWRHDKSVVCQLTLWDAVRVGGQDLGRRPLEERRAALEALVDGSEAEDVTAVRQLPATRETLEAVRSEAVEHWRREELRSGFIHGVVLKRRGSPRRDHCSRCVEHADWMKICFFPQN